MPNSEVIKQEGSKCLLSKYEFDLALLLSENSDNDAEIEFLKGLIDSLKDEIASFENEKPVIKLTGIYHKDPACTK